MGFDLKSEMKNEMAIIAGNHTFGAYQTGLILRASFLFMPAASEKEMKKGG
jgi:hypothetical protein